MFNKKFAFVSVQIAACMCGASWSVKSVQLSGIEGGPGGEGLVIGEVQRVLDGVHAFAPRGRSASNARRAASNV